MIFDNVKEGDRFYCNWQHHVIVVTEVTILGFKYSCPPFNLMPARYGYSQCTGGELHYKLKQFSDDYWNNKYRKVNDDESGSDNKPTCTITTIGDSGHGHNWKSASQEKCPFCLGSGLRTYPTFSGC